MEKLVIILMAIRNTIAQLFIWSLALIIMIVLPIVAIIAFGWGIKEHTLVTSIITAVVIFIGCVICNLSDAKEELENKKKSNKEPEE